MWGFMKDSTVKAKSFKAAISYFTRLHPEAKDYMDQLKESLENMPVFYPDGLHTPMKEAAGIIWDGSQYIEWNNGVYAMGIEWVDEDHVYLYLNSNEIGEQEKEDQEMKKEIKTTTTWCAEDVKAFCIRHNFYTCGYTTEYSKMLTFVDSKNPTTTNIYKVAQDIMDHTDMNRLDTDGLEITDFMYLINVECVRTFFEIID